MEKQVTDPRIRTATPADAKLLSTLSERTFAAAYRNHFERDFSLTALESYLHETFSLEKMAEELAAPKSAVFFLEGSNMNKPIGYARIADLPAPSCVPRVPSCSIQRLYVDAPFQSQGYGTALLLSCLDWGLTHSYDYLWLGVWEENVRAIRLYERLGFRPLGYEKFQITGSEFYDRDRILGIPL